MAETIDARGQACPRPVVMTKNALQKIESGELTVIVDDPVAQENVLRLARSSGCDVAVEQHGEEHHLLITKEAGSVAATTDGENIGRTVVFISSGRIGEGAEELGELLQKAFIYSLAESDSVPSALVLMNNGVKLAVEGSDVLDDLVRLKEAGTNIMVCGTCVDYYKIKEQVRVGILSNMYDIVETFMAADKVVSV